MLKRFSAALLASCVLVAPAFAGYMRTINDTQYLAPFLQRLSLIAPNHPLLASFTYSEDPQIFVFENLDRLVQLGKCASYSPQATAVKIFVDMANRVLPNSDLATGTRVAYEFGQLIGDDGFLFCREEKSGWMSWNEHFYFVTNDGAFKIRFVLSEKD